MRKALMEDGRYAPHVNRVEVEEPLKCQKCTAMQEAAIANITFT